MTLFFFPIYLVVRPARRNVQFSWKVITMANDITLALSADGMVRNSLKRADIQLSRFIVSEQNQTPFVDNKFSLPYLLARYQGDDLTLAIEVKNALEVVMKESFPQVLCRATVEKHPEKASWKLLKIELSMIDAAGNQVQVDRLVTTDDSRFIEIAKINNGSLPYSG